MRNSSGGGEERGGPAGPGQQRAQPDGGDHGDRGHQHGAHLGSRAPTSAEGACSPGQGRGHAVNSFLRAMTSRAMELTIRVITNRNRPAVISAGMPELRPAGLTELQRDGRGEGVTADFVDHAS